MIGPTALPVEEFWRRTRVESLHDGDTLTMYIDLGFNIRVELPLRVYGVNAPELSTDAGKASLAWAEQWVQDHTTHSTNINWPYMVQYISWDKYAPRFDGILVCGLNHCYNDDILAAGQAVPMKGEVGEKTTI